ncbi:hypothetical protein DRP53_10460 [candidate division WOR-3 bacterium]|uniref:Capsule assembly Wzi family protein n=1 Tax=candidate division WOR-3 bacterium TaxID=2052148 RepID=A0A660SD16_UNCW3|nr:MAG: hypothetical protein DRP53_10460 [candidate division WOR-3 bacterium]
MIIVIIFSIWIYDANHLDIIDEHLIRGEEVVDFPLTLPYLKLNTEVGSLHPLSARGYLKSDSLFSFRISPILNYPVTNLVQIRLAPFLTFGDDPSYPLPKWKGKVRGDFEEAGIALNLRPFHLLIGRMRRRWGVENSLILSGWNYPFDNFGFRFELRPILFSYFHGRLERLTGDSSLIPLYGDSILSRYLVGHRIELRLSRRLHLGFTETCLYATPGGIDLTYLNPLLLYYEVQWNKEAWEGERVDDNIVWAFDFRLDLPPTLYFQLMLDDYQYEPPPDSEPNEIGFIAGIKVPIGRFTISAEYTRLNNFCYDTQRPYLRYAYLGQPLGYYHGPDLDDLRIRGRFYRHPLLLQITAFRHRKGEGRFNDPWPSGIFPRPDFLTGVVEEGYGVEGGLGLYLRNLLIKIETGVHHYDNYHNQTGRERLIPVVKGVITLPIPFPSSGRSGLE